MLVINNIVSYQNWLTTKNIDYSNKKIQTITTKNLYVQPFWTFVETASNLCNISHVLSTQNIYVFVIINTNICNIAYIPY
jgi:hypothetical protein